MTEIQRKLERVREKLREGEALRLKGVDWFAWATGGGDSSVIFSAEAGIAEIFISREEALVLTSDIEKTRLANEQVSGLEIRAFPWADSRAIPEYLANKGLRLLSDRPGPGEMPLNPSWLELKWRRLLPEEVDRYRQLGRDAAEAARAALALAEPSFSEERLAGIAASELWRRGIHPLLTLVGGEQRLPEYRHPVATTAPLGGRAMLVICGRRHGLYANLTRHVFFREPTAEERQRERDVALVEAEAFATTEERLPLNEIYRRLAEKYRALGYPGEIRRHHQGGATGYLSREIVADPGRLEEPLPDMAFAWNPSLVGAKIEDTVLLREKIELLTQAERWPSVEIEGRARPAYWVRA